MPAVIVSLIAALASAAAQDNPKIVAPQKTTLPYVDQSPGVALPETPAKWTSSVGPGVPPFWTRPGFHVSLVAENIGEVRFLEFGGHGDLYVSQPTKGNILTLRLKNGKYRLVNSFVEGYRSAHGMYYKDGWLWFTTSGAVYKARDTNGDGKADEVVNVLDHLPSGGHWWRSILVADDGFYTSIGDSGNINDLTGTDREKIWKYSLDGKSRTLFSSGIRNTEKLRFRPGTHEIFGCDHGSDWFGAPLGDKEGFQPITDWNPPCEFNHYVQGGFYGHPFVVGNRVPRIEYQNRPDIVDIAAKTIPPAWDFGPHWAPNGFTFLNRSKLGPDFDGDVLVGLHGSWNASHPQGYRVERILFDRVTQVPYGSQMIVGTIGEDGHTVVGRPVDVAEAPDGSVIFSDDQNNKVYRISREGARR